MQTIIKMPRYEAVLHPAGKTMFIVINQDVDVTDAAPGLEPTQRTAQIDSNGEVNYYEEADSETDRSWRSKLGRFLYKHVVKEDLLKAGIQGAHISRPLFALFCMNMLRHSLPGVATPDKVLIASFPLHYTLWMHKKGHPHDPRVDIYLHGSRFVSQFRSPSEFFLHLKWILEGMPLKGTGLPDCKCCYCDGSRPQGEISKSLGTYHPNERRDRGGKGGGKRGGGQGAKSRSQAPTTIPFKDYTKLPPA
ncbi:hypothetical protein C8Q80DRAFT_847521 [Daedaleopsis nitida]|nr:hypothetical protein C8Q80DRAFT_847521 [Daedaleopsis nitida]